MQTFTRFIISEKGHPLKIQRTNIENSKLALQVLVFCFVDIICRVISV